MQHKTEPTPTATSTEEPELFTFEADERVFALNWTWRADKPFRLALGSYREHSANTVSIIHVDEARGTMVAPPHLSFAHDFPPTKLQFLPDQDPRRPDLLATSGEFLRIWSIQDTGVHLARALSNPSNAQFSGPLTSFDWCEADASRLGTCSLDTTCTIWDVETGRVDTQLIAHDREVHDIAWGGATIFGTVSADGSVRVFDLRDKEHSSIIYEHPDGAPLARLAWSRQDPRLLAATAQGSASALVLDIRFPAAPCTELTAPGGPINALAWAPHSASHLGTAGEDASVLIWDLREGGGSSCGGAADDPPRPGPAPILAYTAGAPVTSLQWSTQQPEWLAISFRRTVQALRV